MGAWGFGNFENDDALDWLFELESSEDLSAVEGAITAATTADGEELDVYIGARALAAAEVVAALRGQAADDLPDEVTIWLEGKTPPSEDLEAAARDAVMAVASASELAELWEETEEDDFAAWRSIQDDLISRLSAS